MGIMCEASSSFRSFPASSSFHFQVARPLLVVLVTRIPQILDYRALRWLLCRRNSRRIPSTRLCVLRLRRLHLVVVVIVVQVHLTLLQRGLLQAADLAYENGIGAEVVCGQLLDVVSSTFITI